MPDLFTDEYENAKRKWEKAREIYNESIRLYEAIYIMLKHQHRELELAAKEFQIQQSIAIKTGKNLSSVNIKSIKSKKGGEDGIEH